MTVLRDFHDRAESSPSRSERMPLCVKWLGQRSSGLSSRPSMAVVSPRLQVVRPHFAAGAPPGPAASPAARWQRSRKGQLCPGSRALDLLARP
jgi:hypothetical protein